MRALCGFALKASSLLSAELAASSEGRPDLRTRTRPVRRTSPYSLCLLVAFVLGGFVAPSVHQAWHAEEWARQRAEHVADGHHHHAANDAHGPEAAAPCPRPMAVDLQCVLCHGASFSLPSAAAAVFAPASFARLCEAPLAPGAEASTGPLSIRGPPGQVT